MYFLIIKKQISIFPRKFVNFTTKKFFTVIFTSHEVRVEKPKSGVSENRIGASNFAALSPQYYQKYSFLLSPNFLQENCEMFIPCKGNFYCRLLSWNRKILLTNFFPLVRGRFIISPTFLKQERLLINSIPLWGR